LIKKRGFIRKEKQILPVSSNKLVEQELGDLGCICIEDVSSELMVNGAKTEEILKRLCTFKLTKPTEGYP
jgi:large subunit ribosomal protein L7e